jgi:ubiquinone/menaquinone biosynthesis C-methylase UbiE
MAEVNLLELYPRAKRDLERRAEISGQTRAIARKFGREFFDGSRDEGYGGYRYDGRWVPVVKYIIEHYALPEQAAILDVGCAKGFMLHDFKLAMPSCFIAGIDISAYAVENAMESVRSSLQVANCRDLPYTDKSFDLVISINTVHNLKLEECKKAIREIERVGRQHKFIVVDAYSNDEEKDRMYKWNLTAQTILHVQEWIKLFREVGYSGDYYWFKP